MSFRRPRFARAVFSRRVGRIVGFGSGGGTRFLTLCRCTASGFAWLVAPSIGTRTLPSLRRAVCRTIGIPITRSKRNFDFDDLIPLRVSPITLGDGQQFAEPAARILSSRIIHERIMTHSAAVIQQPERANFSGSSWQSAVAPRRPTWLHCKPRATGRFFPFSLRCARRLSFLKARPPERHVPGAERAGRRRKPSELQGSAARQGMD